MIEHDGRVTDLDRAMVPGIREVLEPIRSHLAQTLTPVAGEEGILQVVFIVAENGTVRINLRGDVFLVNQARDLIGPEDMIAPRLQ
jgi:hypothetical protein